VTKPLTINADAALTQNGFLLRCSIMIVPLFARRMSRVRFFQRRRFEDDSGRHTS